MAKPGDGPELSGNDVARPSSLRRSFAVIPAYRAASTLRVVVERVLTVVDEVIVVEDGCPERCSETLSEVQSGGRLHVLRREKNGGVGAATKTGMLEALALGADVVVKVDADGQMDSSYIPHMVAFLRSQPEVDLIKGNRFASSSTIRDMPLLRLLGNAGLTFLVKFSSGYWTIVDPTNGFIAVRARALQETALPALADRYFFEIDLLCSFGLRRRPIAELEMPAIYGNQPSSLSITKALFDFPAKLFWRFLRRIIINYVVFEINVGSLCGFIGLPLLVAALIFGGHEWAVSIQFAQPRPTGTIILALLLFMTGFQLSLQALLYDVQFATRTIKLRRDPSEEPRTSREVLLQ